MSDYLERLVARSFDPPDAIRPRPLGLFEAASPGSAPTEPVPGEEESAGAARPPAAVRPPRTEASPRDVAVTRVPVPAMPVSPPVTPSRAAVNENAAVPPVPATVVSPEPRQVRPHDTAGAPPSMTPPPKRERSQPTSPPLPLQRTIVQQVQRDVIIERLAAAERGTEQPRRERQPEPVAAAEPSAPGSRVSHVPPPHQALRSRPTRPQQVTAPRAPDVRSRRDSNSPAEPAAAPSIHVTIGRVEVRAVQPAAARRRPAAAGPAVMSLDEYLKQRAGGDRS